MGVDANAILTGTKDPIEVLNFLHNHFSVTDARITPTPSEDFVWLRFTYAGESRQLAVFYNGSGYGDYQHIYPFEALYVILGHWGFSDAIIVALTEEFGGFYRLNDFDGGWHKLTGKREKL